MGMRTRTTQVAVWYGVTKLLTATVKCAIRSCSSRKFDRSRSAASEALTKQLATFKHPATVVSTHVDPINTYVLPSIPRVCQGSSLAPSHQPFTYAVRDHSYKVCRLALSCLKCAEGLAGRTSLRPNGRLSSCRDRGRAANSCLLSSCRCDRTAPSLIRNCLHPKGPCQLSRGQHRYSRPADCPENPQHKLPISTHL
jgi:hypothetical protein